MTVDIEKVNALLEEQLDIAKREIGALHILLAAIIGEGNTARVPDSALAGAAKALKMTRDESTSEFVIKVVSEIPENVV